MLTVKELVDNAGKLTPSFTPVVLGDLQYEPTVSVTGRTSTSEGLIRKSTGEIFYFGEKGFDNFAKHLGMPAYFMDKLPPTLRTQIVDHFLDVNKERESNIAHFDSEIHNLFKTNVLLVPPRDLIERISRIFKPEDVVSRLDFMDGLVVNVRTTEVQNASKPGDITQGGIRFNAFYGNKPQVSAYMERLVCSNGMVATNDLDTIPVRGFTNNEVLANIEHMASHYLNTLLPRYLDNWQRMTTITSTNPEQLVHRLAREADLSPKLESRIIDAVSSLEDNTYYDVVNLITSFQNAEDIETAQFEKLQKLGGSAIRDLGGHRCTSCQHNLD